MNALLKTVLFFTIIYSSITVASPTKESTEISICNALYEYRNLSSTPSLSVYGLFGINHNESMSWIHWSRLNSSGTTSRYPYKSSSSCKITNWQNNSFAVNFVYQESNNSLVSNPIMKLWNNVDANVMCIFTSSYEWQCLYQSSNFDIHHEHIARHPQQMEAILGAHYDRVFEQSWQVPYLTTIQNIASSQL